MTYIHTTRSRYSPRLPFSPSTKHFKSLRNAHMAGTAKRHDFPYGLCQCDDSLLRPRSVSTYET